MDVTIIDTLIALVEERPTIWDKRAKSHAKRLTVEKCWKEISEALKVDENALRKKWKYLRDQFCVELGKSKNSNSAKWRHFNALEFLTETVTPRVYGKHGYSQSEEDGHSSSDSFARNTAKAKKKKKQDKKKKKKKKPSIASVTDLEKTFEDSNFSSFEKFSEEEDEHLHFFRSVLPHVRKIAGSKVLSFRGRIQSLVEEFAYGVHPGASSAFVPAVSSAFVPEALSIKVSPPRYSSEACDPIDTSD